MKKVTGEYEESPGQNYIKIQQCKNQIFVMTPCCYQESGKPLAGQMACPPPTPRLRPPPLCACSFFCIEPSNTPQSLLQLHLSFSIKYLLIPLSTYSEHHYTFPGLKAFLKSWCMPSWTLFSCMLVLQKCSLTLLDYNSNSFSVLSSLTLRKHVHGQLFQGRKTLQ